jgi:cell wall-associated NlpC family hydrolase
MLQTAKNQHADARLHVFDVEIVSHDERALKLRGRVLERANLEYIKSSLPRMTIDDSSVHVLRANPSVERSVATNLTDLHAEPSFLSELRTQVTYGVRLEILNEQDKWVLVRQADGYLGWAYQPYLRDDSEASPTHVVASPVQQVFDLDQLTPITRLLGGTHVHVTPGGRVEIAPVGEPPRPGVVSPASLRLLASLPLPPADARRQMIDDARQFTGVYYLWGGCSAFGIDCSGLAQLAHKLAGYTIPRDADMQFAAGRPVEGGPESFQPGDLLFFTGDHNRRKISHVGISTGGWNMIHSSRFHNGVYEDDVQQRPHLRDTFAGARTFLPPG